MDISKIKKVGTREEVYKNLAIRTAGNLKKDDIIEKVFGNKTMYISKKLSDKMKENIQILRTHNPNFMKKMQKKTMVVSTPEIINNTIPNKSELVSFIILKRTFVIFKKTFIVINL